MHRCLSLGRVSVGEVPDSADWAVAHGPVCSHKALDCPWMWRRAHMPARGRVTVTCCRHELVGFQGHEERGAGLALGTQGNPHSSLLLWAFTKKLESTHSQPQAAAPYSRWVTGEKRGDKGLTSAISDWQCGEGGPGRSSCVSLCTSAMFPGGQLSTWRLFAYSVPYHTDLPDGRA